MRGERDFNRGVVEAFIDGERCRGPPEGWSSYEWRLRYRTHEIAGVGRRLGSRGNGWARGRLAEGGRAYYGDELGASPDSRWSSRRPPSRCGDGHDLAGRPSEMMADDLYDGQTMTPGRRVRRPEVAPSAVGELDLDTALLDRT